MTRVRAIQRETCSAFSAGTSRGDVGLTVNRDTIAASPSFSRMWRAECGDTISPFATLWPRLLDAPGYVVPTDPIAFSHGFSFEAFNIYGRDLFGSRSGRHMVVREDLKSLRVFVADGDELRLKRQIDFPDRIISMATQHGGEKLVVRTTGALSLHQ